MTSVAYAYSICSVCLLKNNLKRRGYKQNIIKKSFSKANTISRSSLLQYKEKQKCKRTPCVLTYHPLTLLVYDDECCIFLQHLQRLSPQEWLLCIVVLGFDISARTNRFLRLFSCCGLQYVGESKQTPEWTQKWPYKKDISSCEPALQTVWPQSRGFQQKATMVGSGKTLDSLECFSTDVQCPRMVLKLFLRQGWYVRTQGVLSHFCFSLYWSKHTTIDKSHSCGDKRCKCCKHMQHSSSYTSKVTGTQCKIFCTVNCKSANVIYIVKENIHIKLLFSVNTVRM
jgi:hypothetical protein